MDKFLYGKGKFVIYGFIFMTWVFLFVMGYEHRQYVVAQERMVNGYRVLHEESETKVKSLEAELKSCKQKLP